MSGWIKLWRRTIDHGHFNMPDICFKLWVYCLLKATPFANGELAAGELWLSYKEIQQNLAQQGRTISKSTIAAALRFLQEQDYLMVDAAPLQGMKVKVRSWRRYQAREDTDSLEDVLAEESQGPGTATVPMELSTGTPAVPVTQPSGTPTVLAWYSESTSTGTPTVPVQACEANNDAAYQAPKNILKNTKEYGNKNTPQTPQQQNSDKRATLQDILAQFPRYSSRQTDTIRDYWRHISQTRKNRTISLSIVAKQMKHWERYPTEVVLEAINIHLARHQDKREEYTAGIMRRLTQEWDKGGIARKGDYASGSYRKNTEQANLKRPTSRYAHLVQ